MQRPGPERVRVSAASDERAPVVLLVFANDRYDGGVGGYLRHLAREDAVIREALKPAVGAGHCQLVRDTSVTHTELFDLLDEHGRDVVGLHFGGHADPRGLLLTDEAGESTPAHIEGIAQRLGNLPALRWIFFNGCGTAAHIEVLHRHAPVPLVATSTAIRDDAAVTFARRFYTGLGRHLTIGEAFANAQAELRSLHPTAGEVVRDGPGGDPWAQFRMLEPAEDAEPWPWVLALPPGTTGLAKRGLIELEPTAGLETPGPVEPRPPTVDLRAPAKPGLDTTVDGHGRGWSPLGAGSLETIEWQPGATAGGGEPTVERGPRGDPALLESTHLGDTPLGGAGSDAVGDPRLDATWVGVPLSDALPRTGAGAAAETTESTVRRTLPSERPQREPSHRQTTEMTLEEADDASPATALWRFVRVLLVPVLVVLGLLAVGLVITPGVVDHLRPDAGAEPDAAARVSLRVGAESQRATEPAVVSDATPVRVADAIDARVPDAMASAPSVDAIAPRVAVAPSPADALPRLEAELSKALDRCRCREARRLGASIEAAGATPDGRLEPYCRPRRGDAPPGRCGIALGGYLDRAIAGCPCAGNTRFLLDTLESVYDVHRTYEVTRRCWTPGAPGACR